MLNSLIIPILVAVLVIHSIRATETRIGLERKVEDLEDDVSDLYEKNLRLLQNIKSLEKDN